MPLIVKDSPWLDICLPDPKISPQLLSSSAPQNLLHLPSPCQLVDQLVHVSGLLGQGSDNIFNSIATDRSGDQARIGVESGLRKELFEGGFFFNLPIQVFLGEASKPCNDFLQFFNASPLLFDLVNVVRINRTEGHFCDSLVVLFGGCHDFEFSGREGKSLLFGSCILAGC